MISLLIIVFFIVLEEGIYKPKFKFKPDYTDLADIPAHFNGNMDTIDAELKENADAIVSVGTELSNHETQQLINFEKKSRQG